MGAATGALVAFLAITSNPTIETVSDQVDLIEVNHFYDENGRLVFDQIIFFDWSEVHGRYHVRAWRLLKRPSQIPQRDWQRGGYVTTWHDGDVLRQVRSVAVRETWTQYDPELAEREFLPKDRRLELSSALPYLVFDD